LVTTLQTAGAPYGSDWSKEGAGLQLASDGSYDGQPEEVVEKVFIAYLKGDGKVVHVAPTGSI
jgi:hypothetical protein